MQGDIDQRFEYGLDLMIAGLRAKADAGSSNESVSD
jgi:hypothetical protein